MTQAIADWLRCKVCHSEDIAVIRDIDGRGGAEAITVECEECGMTESVIR